VKITIDMEPRELHEVLMLATAAFGPDEPPKPPVKVHSKRPKQISASKYPYGENLPAPTKEIRQWAKDAGFHVAKGGTLPKDVIDAYKEAM
jgi:hypothetical protein